MVFIALYRAVPLRSLQQLWWCSCWEFSLEFPTSSIQGSSWTTKWNLILDHKFEIQSTKFLRFKSSTRHHSTRLREDLCKSHPLGMISALCTTGPLFSQEFRQGGKANFTPRFAVLGIFTKNQQRLKKLHRGSENDFQMRDEFENGWNRWNRWNTKNFRSKKWLIMVYS